ncbi:Argonaute complex, subunit Arb1 [Aspergillus filifer]
MPDIESPPATQDENAEASVTLGIPKKKNKKSRKPKSKRGKNKPTGFEEYYVDAPITAEEHQFELDLYHVSLPIVHRLEAAILRFSKNRRIETDRLEVFHKYLAYGGIDVGPKMFAGTDDRGLKEMDNEQILLARGNTAISENTSHLTIDFEVVVKGFLSSYFPFFFMPYNQDMIKLATVTIRSFLSYLLYHDVCPEYKRSIDDARTSCDIATEELWKNQQLMASPSSDFNVACAILFGGLDHDLYVDDNQWRNPKHDMLLMTKDIAQKVLRFGLGVAGSDELAILFQQMGKDGNLKAAKLEGTHGFEVTEVQFPNEEACKIYSHQAPDLHPVGVLHATAYWDPAEPEYDLSDEERQEWTEKRQSKKQLTFFLEERYLELCYPGMKIIANVWEVNCGFHYLEEVIRAYCSIYTPLANELMLGWKEPRTLAASDKKKEEEDDDEKIKIEGNEITDANLEDLEPLECL